MTTVDEATLAAVDVVADYPAPEVTAEMTEVIPAPAVEEPEKKKAKAKKPRSAPTHPPFLEMITEAIVTLKEKTGSSQYAITKFIEENQKQLPSNFRKLLLGHLKKLVASGKLVKVKHSFKLPPAKSPISVSASATVSKPKPGAKKKVVGSKPPKAGSARKMTTKGKVHPSKPIKAGTAQTKLKVAAKPTKPKPAADKPKAKTVSKPKLKPAAAKPVAKPKVAKPAPKRKTVTAKPKAVASKPKSKPAARPTKAARTSTRTSPGKRTRSAAKPAAPVKKTPSRKGKK